MVKIQGGTPSGDQPVLCKSCRFAHNIRGMNLQEVSICQVNGVPRRVPFPVVECSKYQNAATPPLYEMENIAWVVQSRKRGPVGFAGGKPEMDVIIKPPRHEDEEGTPLPSE